MYITGLYLLDLRAQLLNLLSLRLIAGGKGTCLRRHLSIRLRALPHHTHQSSKVAAQQIEEEEAKEAIRMLESSLSTVIRPCP